MKISPKYAGATSRSDISQKSYIFISTEPGTSRCCSETPYFPVMLTAALGLLMLVAAVESFIGLVGNGVLVVWSFQECIKKFKKSSYPLIVLGLAGC